VAVLEDVGISERAYFELLRRDDDCVVLGPIVPRAVRRHGKTHRSYGEVRYRDCGVEEHRAVLRVLDEGTGPDAVVSLTRSEGDLSFGPVHQVGADGVAPVAVRLPFGA